jgi:hypothetical protein
MAAAGAKRPVAWGLTSDFGTKANHQPRRVMSEFGGKAEGIYYG